MKRQIFVAGLLGFGLMASATFASDDCVAPMSTWQPREAMEQKAIEMGWTVDRIRTDDGCYKVYGKDANGQRIEAKFDPATFELVKLKQGDEFKHEDEDEKPDADGTEQGTGN
ncbi:MAG: PepSY domain-containing protein [Pseudorhodobacter sp.]|nr:PepSY domain-containing protein [Pseudorhodobacter sp.]